MTAAEAAPAILELAGFPALEIPPLQGSPRQVEYARQLRDDELHQLRRWWIEAERYGDPGGEPPQSASWRGFARRHLYARAQARWAAWLTGRSEERAERPVAEEIFARAAAVDLDKIKRALHARIATAVAREAAVWWIERSKLDTVYEGVLHLGERDPLPRRRG